MTENSTGSSTPVQDVVMPQFLYLVNLCHAMDDIPIRLFIDLDTALRFARSLDWNLSATMQKRLELPSCSTPCCITVTTFKDGTPISRTIVRDYDSENDGID